MSKISSLKRTLEILNDLNNGKVLNITNLSMRFDVSTRTIYRDINAIEDSFDNDFLKREGENIFAIEKKILDSTLGGTEISTLNYIVNTFKQAGLPIEVDGNLKKLLKENDSVFDFNSKPQEQLINKDILKVLEKSIKSDRVIKFKYKQKNGLVEYTYKPYKIKFLNENFYLLGINEKDDFFILRINQIKEIELSPKSFYKKKDILDFIEGMQTPFATPYAAKTKVLIKVKPHVARHFLLKKFFKSQVILEQDENDYLIVEYTVNGLPEIEEFLIRWLPNIIILSPEKLKTNIKKSLEYKARWLDDNVTFSDKSNYVED